MWLLSDVDSDNSNDNDNLKFRSSCCSSGAIIAHGETCFSRESSRKHAYIRDLCTRANHLANTHPHTHTLTHLLRVHSQSAYFFFFDYLKLYSICEYLCVHTAYVSYVCVYMRHMCVCLICRRNYDIKGSISKYLPMLFFSNGMKIRCYRRSVGFASQRNFCFSFVYNSHKERLNLITKQYQT